MSDLPPVWGSKEEALANARRLLAYDPNASIEQAEVVIARDPDSSEAYRLLGMALRRLGRVEEASRAEENAIALAMIEPKLFEAMMAMTEQNLPKAERLLRERLRDHPDDAAALRMLAEVAARTGHFDAAERLIGQALTVAPSFTAVRNLLSAVQRVRDREKDEPSTQRSSVALDDGLSGEEIYVDAVKLYDRVVAQFPERTENWISYGYVLRIIGRQDDALEKFRRALVAQPSSGEAWWAIADLKAARFTKEDLATLTSLAAGADGPATNLSQLNFALARALEQFGNYKDAFTHYVEGNRLRALSSTHDPDAVSRHVDRSIALFDKEFFHRRDGAGDATRDPIFVLGMPRAGSTLVEQILSSHPAIEGVSELPDLPGLANWLGNGKEAGFEDTPYLEKLAALPIQELQRLGRGYIWNSGLRRRSMKPFFVDKMPNNWLHLGLLLAILPNAKIIDARRHPLACCVSNFRQYYAKGQEFSYDLKHMGRFYADYVRMMAHFDELMPGRIYRVVHEDLVEQPESQIRKLLAHLDLPFDTQCLRFYESKRAVGTASSEQVRRPINREGLDQWRAFEPWLGPLKDALGPIVDFYPAVPGMSDR
ncbi:MAG TPA: sulfotransferase [Sphingomicrobium sp.]